MARRDVRPTGLGLKVLSVVALLLAALALPALAAAKGAATTSIEIGPFKAAHGYTFDLVVSDCAQASKETEFDYSKGPDSNFADYSYSGAATCTSSTNLKKGTLSLSWPGIATANLKIAVAGRKKAHHVVKGCTGGSGFSRQVVLKGTIDITANKYFGSLKGRKIKAFIDRGTAPKCRTTAAAEVH